MTTEVAPEAIALSFIQQLVPALETQIKSASAFNDLPNIPWNLRQKVRTLEGKLDGIVIDCIDIVATMHTKEAEAYLEEQWPDP